MKPDFGEVIEILKKQGLSDEKIGKFVESLNNALSQNLYLTIVEKLSEEDMKMLNSIADEVERQSQMQQMFETKSGQSLKNISDEFIKSFTNEFLEGYRLSEFKQMS